MVGLEGTFWRQPEVLTLSVSYYPSPHPTVPDLYKLPFFQLLFQMPSAPRSFSSCLWSCQRFEISLSLRLPVLPVLVILFTSLFCEGEETLRILQGVKHVFVSDFSP